MKTIINIFLISFLDFAFSSCVQKPQTAYINPQLKSFFQFKEGSSFVYVDSLTGIRDTFISSSPKLGDFFTFDDGNQFEQAGVELCSNHKKITYSAAGSSPQYNSELFCTFDQDTSQWLKPIEFPVTVSPYLENYRITNHGNFTNTVLKRHTSFEVRGKAYSDVYEIISVCTPDLDDKSFTYNIHSYFSYDYTILKCSIESAKGNDYYWELDTAMVVK